MRETEKERFREKENRREREIHLLVYSTNCPEHPGLIPAKAKSQKLHPNSSSRVAGAQ